MSDISSEAQLHAPRDARLSFLAGVTVRVTVELGAKAMRLSDILDLRHDSVVELDRAADAPLDLLVNGTLVARGEVVGVDGRYGLRVTEVVAPERGLAGAVRLG